MGGAGLDIEFTEGEIRVVWSKVFSTICPAELRTKVVFEACLMELGGEQLRLALHRLRQR